MICVLVSCIYEWLISELPLDTKIEIYWNHLHKLISSSFSSSKNWWLPIMISFDMCSCPILLLSFGAQYVVCSLLVYHSVSIASNWFLHCYLNWWILLFAKSFIITHSLAYIKSSASFNFSLKLLLAACIFHLSLLVWIQFYDCIIMQVLPLSCRIFNMSSLES